MISKSFRIRLIAGLVSLFCATLPGQKLGDYPIRAVPFENVTITEGFWQPRIDTNRSATVPHIIQQCLITGRLDNFEKAAGKKQGHFEGWWFNDSDVYKTIEGAALSLVGHRDPGLERRLDSIIAVIAAAQEPDGYLYTPRKTTAPDYRFATYVGPERWSNLESSHELYDLGHLYEAAVAYQRATGKRSLLDVAVKSADLLTRVFGPGKNRSVPGHQEIEIGLTKLYRATGKADFAQLAKFFLDERGRADGHKLYGEYSQDHRAVTEQDSAVGHAVRALYMYAGMTDMVALFGDASYRRALDILWGDVVGRKTYLTGGIGAAGGHEGFSYAFQLPNLVAYCETCASIAAVLWNQRMFQLTGDGKYVDVLERTLYNAMLSGVALDGRTFFYPNPLESDGRHSRSPWFAVACCPPNISRILPQVAELAYAATDDGLYVNLYAASSMIIRIGREKTEVAVSQVTEYPWNGKIRISVDPKAPTNFALHLRIPGWANNEAIPGGLYTFQDRVTDPIRIQFNGMSLQYRVSNGYVSVRREWKKGDVVELELPMPVRRVVSRPEVKDNIGKVALQRGPLVYCIEWPDVKDGRVVNLVLNDKEKLAVGRLPNLFGGVTAIRGSARGLRCAEGGGVSEENVDFTAIPYYAWAHRGKGEMSVWLARMSLAARPIPCPTMASTSTVSASGGEPEAVNDLREPSSSIDHTNRFLHWWPRKATTEWVQYDFKTPAKVSAVEVYWFDDTGIGECRLPKSWSLLYKDGTDWKQVENPGGYGVEKDRYNRTTFKPVTTDGLRIVVQLPDGFSAGIHEWRVF